MKIRKAVIPAGGKGTRFFPVTKCLPKEMLPLLNKPLIQYSVEEAVACGIELVIIITAHGKRTIEDYFDRSQDVEQYLQEKGQIGLAEDMRRLSTSVDMAFLPQKEQLGLGHAVLSAKRVIGNEPFLLLLPDDLFESDILKQMMQVYRDRQSSVIAVQRVAENDISRYGIVDAQKVDDRIYEISDLVEKPKRYEAPSNLAVMGRYILESEVFHYLEDTPPGAHGEIQLTDALKLITRRHSIYAYEFEGQRYDAGTPEGWLQTNIALALKDKNLGPGLAKYLETLMRSRVYR
jgi:UTP--glucose-1-phosphate uridylyltransferase